ncbi:MAG: DUF4980 domain-containing protein, partial [Bacteroidales bacterium]|nr:DUF4980 domain-containing protein [Bacteroidales bacterium]
MLSAAAQQTFFTGGKHAIIKDKAQKKIMLLPVQEDKDGANIQVMYNGKTVKTLNVKLAVDKVDYYVPLSIEDLNGKNLVFDIEFWGGEKKTEDVKNYLCWKQIKQADSFDTQNTEKFRPEYHHSPAYGWMNDPNGMFYLNGVYHLYYQWNPYGSQWENMTWGHSSSTDLINWKHEPTAIERDNLGTIFSGSCIVDKNNTAGFGQNAVVAFYTTEGRNQVQCLAYSTDGGKTFTKYDGNPILTDENRDFRDPKVFWNDQIPSLFIMKRLHIILLFFLVPLVLSAQRKQLLQAQEMIKTGTTLDKAESLMASLLRESKHRNNPKLWLTLYQAQRAQYEQANEKLYLKQKNDTSAFFRL